VSLARVGWLGGTFDPIHDGHLDVAGAARSALGLHSVYLVPAHTSPHRAAPRASSAHRLAMVNLAASTQDWLRVSAIELAAPGPSYTTDTLDRLEAQGMSLQSFHVITGADAFAEILTWKGSPALLDRCHFIVVSRPGHPAPELRQVLPGLAHRMIEPECDLAAQPSIFLVDAPTAPVTATEVRARAKSGSSLKGLVPEAVASYINRHELYQGEA
jgi:nicotinate-nucleotide adenylyltransferase